MNTDFKVGDKVWIPTWHYTESRDVHARRDDEFGIRNYQKIVRGKITKEFETSYIIQLESLKIAVKKDFTHKSRSACVGALRALVGNDEW